MSAFEGLLLVAYAIATVIFGVGLAIYVKTKRGAGGMGAPRGEPENPLTADEAQRLRAHLIAYAGIIVMGLLFATAMFA